MEPLPPLDPSLLRPGKYRHYKGNDYEVIGLARHSETLETLVLYRALYGEGGLWVRPLAMFLETVEVGGRRVPRFEFISTKESI
jgi:cyclomaltodextrinase